MIIDIGYRGVLRPLLFRAYGGDAERIHEQTLAAIARIGRSRPALAALATLCARHRTPATAPLAADSTECSTSETAGPR